MTSSYPELLKVEAVATSDPAHDIQEVRREDERHSLSAHAQKVLPVSEDVTEVDVKQVPCEAQETQEQGVNTTA